MTTRRPFDNTTLHKLCEEQGDLTEQVKEALKYDFHRANLETKNTLGCTPLMSAVCSRNPGVVQVLIAHNADMETRGGGPCSDTALITAATYGNAEIAGILLRAGAERNTKGNGGATALWAAAVTAAGDDEIDHTIDIVQTLLAFDCDKTIPDDYGRLAVTQVLNCKDEAKKKKLVQLLSP